jgi:5-methylcytosine-specific restriction endonuclease McrA
MTGFILLNPLGFATIAPMPTLEERAAQKAKYNRAYYLKHKAEIIAQHGVYRKSDAGRAMRRREKANRKARHPDKVLDEWRKYEASEKRKAYMQATREISNLRKKNYYQRHRGHLLAKQREWYEVNRPAVLAKRKLTQTEDNAVQWHRRRALLKAGSVGTDTKATAARIREIKRAEILPCHWCGRETTRAARHVDHMMPLSRGGKHAAENLCCACPTCNCSKKDTPPDSFKPPLRALQSSRD